MYFMMRFITLSTTTALARGFSSSTPAVRALSVLSMSSANLQQNTRRSFVSKSVAFSTVLTTSLPVLQANANDQAADTDLSTFTTTESGMKYRVIQEGKGQPPAAGTEVKAQYTGWLDGFNGAKKFDSSRDRRGTFNFRVGTGMVIKGWDEAFLGMNIGEKREIILPPNLAYGARGAGGVIPPDATLFFEVELVNY